MTTIGYATLDVIPSLKGLAGEIDKQASGDLTRSGKRVGGAFGDHAGREAGGRFGTAFKRAAAIGLAGVGALGVGAFKIGKDAVGEASDLGESLNAVNVSYEKSAGAVKALGREAADSLGLSNTEFNSLAVRFSAFSKTIAGGDGRKVVTTLDDLTTRASDFASVMNLEVAESAELFQSGLAGETEPLRKYGIDLSAAAVEAHAMATGIKAGAGEMTEAEKVQARYSLLMKQTSKSAGDFANTSDSLANRQRILSSRWQDAQAKLGRGLLPIVEQFTGYLLDEGVPAVEKFGRWFNREGVPALERFGRFTRDEVLPVLEDVGSFAADAAGFASDLVKALNDLPKPAKYAGLAALLAGGTAIKLRGGGGGALGTLGKVAGLAKPTPVFVTNPGFGGAGGAPGVVGGPVGGAGKGGWSKVGSALGKAAGPLIAIPIALKINDVAKGIAERPGNQAPGGVAGTKGVEPIHAWAQSNNKSLEKAAELTGRMRSNLAVFGDEADLVGSKKINPSLTVPGLRQERENLRRFYDLEIEAGRPIAPRLDLLGYDVAMEKLYSLRKFKIGDKEINIHTTHTQSGEVDYLSGGVRGARANGGQVLPRQSYLVGERGPEIFRPEGGGSIIANHEMAATGSGVTVNIGTVTAHDYNDFMQQTQRRVARASIGGFGR